MDGPTTPAGANFKDVVAGPELKLPAESIVFLDLRVGEREMLGVHRPARGRVHHRWVEP
jgi:hypothetical protein